MIYLLDLVMTIYQGLLIIYVLRKQTSQRPHTIFYEAAGVTAYVLFYFLIQSMHLMLPEAMIFVIFFAYAKLISFDSLPKCMFWAILDTCLFLGTLTLVSGLFDLHISINGNVVDASDDVRIIYYFVGNAAVTVVMNIAIQFNKAADEISHKKMLLFIIMLVLIFIINECFFLARLSGNDDAFLLVGVICTFIVMVLMIFLYELLTELTKKQHQMELATQTAQLIAEHQEELKNIYQNMLTVQHDIRHRIAAVEEILDTPGINIEQRHEALALLDLPQQPRLFFTGCLAADAILKAKLTSMEKAGITFEFDEYPLTQLPIPHQDFCMLLGNLLDNAIEGVMRLPAERASRHIQLSFSKVWDILFISCINDVDVTNIKRRGEEFLSSKDSPELHGFGIKSMKKIVESAGGSIEFHIGRDKFTVEIMLGRIT